MTQTSIPSTPRAWVRFTLSRTTHKRLCAIAWKHGGNLGAVLYAAARSAFPKVLPVKYPRTVGWKSDYYMGAFFVRIFLTHEEVARMVGQCEGTSHTVEQLLERHLGKLYGKQLTVQGELFKAP